MKIFWTEKAKNYIYSFYENLKDLLIERSYKKDNLEKEADLFIRVHFLLHDNNWEAEQDYLGSTLGEEYIAINSILIQFVLISSFF